MTKKIKKQKRDIIPRYCTFPLVDAAEIEEETNRRLPSDKDVQRLRRWSEELKL